MRLRNATPALMLALALNGPITADAKDDDKDVENEEPTEITYFDLKPSIVSNLTGGPKYIRCNIQLMFQYPALQPLIELHLPALRHEVLMLLPEQDGRALMQPDGKESLRKTIREALRKVMQDKTEQPVIDEVYFTAYYVR